MTQTYISRSHSDPIYRITNTTYYELRLTYALLIILLILVYYIIQLSLLQRSINLLLALLVLLITTVVKYHIRFVCGY